MQALITDFTVVPPDAGAPSDGGAADGGAADAAPVATNTVHFGGGATLGGSEFVYPTGGMWPVTSDVSGGSWHMTGTLGDYSGFGLYFDNCSRVDASAYSGISFTISGRHRLPPGGIVTMDIATLDDQIAASWLLAHGGGTPAATDPGRCIPDATATSQYNQTDCADPTKVITVTTTPTKVTILWTDFTGGKPTAAVTPGDIIGIYWFFPPPVGAGTTTPTTYPVDITIDDLSFIAP